MLHLKSAQRCTIKFFCSWPGDDDDDDDDDDYDYDYDKEDNQKDYIDPND